MKFTHAISSIISPHKKEVPQKSQKNILFLETNELRNTKRNGVHRKTTTQARVAVHQRYAILFYYLLAYAHTK